ncbi:MAG TPA: FAD-binding oxidoreductase [Gammaproteobacteria bacterium]|nr:FAD-binding oxidoreductase [Gammaproteobacteria bacterium]
MSETSAIGPLLRAPDGALSLDAPLDLLVYQRDCSALRPGCATQAVRPTDSAQIAALLREASAARVPVYVRGGGTMYAGGVNPQAGGVVLDLGGLDRILEIDAERGVVVVEPGVRFGALAQVLAPLGLTIGIIPSTAPTATIGGAASAHALGTGSARFQSFADQVVGLEVVLADGTVLRTGSAAAQDAGFFHRYGIGPDLSGLFLGGDATLGVITKIALWLHPLPALRRTECYGFADPRAAAAFIGELQRGEVLERVWYGSGYEAASIRARVGAAQPEIDLAGLPGFCIGLDFGGEPDEVARAQSRALEIARRHGGDAFPMFNAIYFDRLRGDQIYWYSFAGYFARSRCGILMASLPTTRMPAFLAVLDDCRAQRPALTWGGAVVLCRRGLHGGLMAFYDEATQWDEVTEALQTCAAALRAAGCIPYKSGKLWAAEVRRMTPYHATLRRLKAALDPAGILSPGNLGL